jgi:hypothetical protein
MSPKRKKEIPSFKDNRFLPAEQAILKISKVSSKMASGKY